MMNKRSLLWGVSGALLLAAVLALIWLLRSDGGAAGSGGGRGKGSASNPALDLRFGYDPAQFRVGAYDPNAEFPLLLEGLVDGKPVWALGGKRIRGIATMLQKAPGQMLFDFVGSQDDEAFVSLYKLSPQGIPTYEDAKVQGQLALHTAQTYRKSATDSAWPSWFPEAVKSGDTAYVEGWAFFSPEDLFFFYAVSPAPISDAQRAACQRVLDSLRFGAILGDSDKAMEEALPTDGSDEAPADSGAAPDEAPAEGKPRIF
jgi:hypothetical protein